MGFTVSVKLFPELLHPTVFLTFIVPVYIPAAVPAGILIPIGLTGNTESTTGTKVFDWTVPKEWNIKDAYVKDREGNKIVDFKKNNLCVVGYSTPIDKIGRAHV